MAKTISDYKQMLNSVKSAVNELDKSLSFFKSAKQDDWTTELTPIGCSSKFELAYQLKCNKLKEKHEKEFKELEQEYMILRAEIKSKE